MEPMAVKTVSKRTVSVEKVNLSEGSVSILSRFRHDNKVSMTLIMRKTNTYLNLRTMVQSIKSDLNNKTAKCGYYCNFAVALFSIIFEED